jgi:hypothetical protein
MLNNKTCYAIIFASLTSLALARPGVAARPPERLPFDISATQLTLRLGPIQGRATVIGVTGDTLTVLTAAHFLTGDNAAGKTVVIRRPGGDLCGRVVAVSANPHFKAGRSDKQRDSPALGTIGVDTSIAFIKVTPLDEDDRRIFDAIKPAELTRHPVPVGRDQIVSVHIVDQFDEEHVVRAGNHLNPKCLAWGRGGYDTRPGDSGSGVFIVRRTPEGAPQVLLIGTVSQTDDRGGIASLAYRDDPWVQKAIESQRADAD